MTKILHILTSLDPRTGGVCQAVISIIRGLAEQNIENEALCLDNPEADFLKKKDFNIHALDGSKTAWSYSSILRPWLKNNIKQYDIIIVHGLWQYQSHAIYKEWKNLIQKPKLYVMPHGMLDPYFQEAKGRKLKAIRNILFWKLIEKRLINSADGILFTCEEEMLLARKPFKPYKPKQESVVGLGVDIPPTYNEKMNTAFKQHCEKWNEKPFILFLSRVDEKKGVDLLIESYTQLTKDNMNMLQLVIAGPGLDTNYGQYIQTMAKENQNILFPGMLSGDAKWGAFYNSEAFVLPSHQENFGIVIAEAMACGKAVLITDKVNIWREIINRKAGIVASDTSEGIVEMLKKWLNLPENEKLKMASNARTTYLETFLHEKVNEKFANILKSLQ